MQLVWTWLVVISQLGFGFMSWLVWMMMMQCGRNGLFGDFGESTIDISSISVATEVTSIVISSIESGVVEDILPGVPNKVSITTSRACFFSYSNNASTAIVALRVMSSSDI